MVVISVLFHKHTLHLTLDYCLKKHSNITEAADEGSKAVATFDAKMHLLSIFDLFSSFSIQHTTVQQTWYTSHVGPLILLPVTQGMER